MAENYDQIANALLELNLHCSQIGISGSIHCRDIERTPNKFEDYDTISDAIECSNCCAHPKEVFLLLNLYKIHALPAGLLPKNDLYTLRL